MADDKQEEQEPLSPEQRLDILEKKVGSNKLILLGLALFLIIVISVSVTIAALGLSGGEEQDSANTEVFTTIQSDIDQIKEQLLGLDTRLAKLNADMELQEIKLANSSNRMIQSTLIDQEANFQTFLTSLRSAVYDLAHMVPGSRAWLELYSDQIDQSLAHSTERVQRLKNIQTTDENAESFFGDF
ncbi:MAG: hypothetical protein C9356_11405 [Oleiphilus sp.]|nr:MAG: hypothetical protein C9356_11405 [Oleiphilus sp.]